MNASQFGQGPSFVKENITKTFFVPSGDIVLENRESFSEGKDSGKRFFDYLMKIRMGSPYGLYTKDLTSVVCKGPV